MILIIDTTSQALHRNEFVRPIENICKELNYNFKSINYKEKIDFNRYEKIIISGNSIQDQNQNKVSEGLKELKNYDKPILGICLGFQVICKIYEGEKFESVEFGLNEIEILKEDPIISKKYLNEIYSLHTKSVSIPKEFEIIAKNKNPQIIKHKKKLTYATLFHPEVRNKDIIKNFIKLQTK